MSIRILTKNAVENTNIDGARQNHFNSGMQSGVVKGAFNEGNIFSPALNAIAIDSCELRISGHQIVIDSAEYITLNDKPYDAKRLSLIAQIKVTEFSEPEFEFIVQAETVKLIQDNLFENERGNGIYQLKLCNFTLGTDGVIRNVIRVVETITGGTNSAVKTDIEFTATATELSASSQPEAVITYNHETGTYDLVFGIPRGGGTDVQVGGISQGIVRFDSDPQQQLDTLNAKIGTASSFKVEIVDELPTENISTSTFYLVKSKTEGENIYNEYLYVNGVWEALGTTSIEAYDDTELRRLIESKADKSALENLSNLVANKVDTTTFNTETARLQGGIKDNTDEIIEIQNAGYITKEVNNLTNYTKSSDLSKVATSNNYNDLDSKPTIPNKLPTPNKLTLKVDGVTKAEFDGSSAEIVNIEIPSTDAVIDIVNQHSESINEINTELAGKADKGSVTANTNAISTINNKLGGIQSGAEVNVQSDWNVTDTSSDAYIKNKPTIPSISGLATESYVNTQVNTLQGKIDLKADKEDLVDYATNEDLNKVAEDILDDIPDISGLASENYVQSVASVINERIDGKQDKITDLATIRSGASAGATAVQPSALDGYYTKAQTENRLNAEVSNINKTLDRLDTSTTTNLNSIIELDERKVNKATTINSKPLSSNITLTASDVGALPSDTEIPTTAGQVGALPNTTLYGASLSLSMNTTDYKVTAQLKDQAGNNLGTAQTIDLPLESVVVSGSYDATNKKVILTLKDGSTIDFSVEDLIDGLASTTYVDTEIDRVEGLIAKGGGTAVSVAGNPVATLEFDSNPQTQINNRLSKSTTANSVYGVSSNGTQMMYDLTPNITTGGTVVVRDPNGGITCANPSTAKQAVNKDYLETELSYKMNNWSVRPNYIVAGDANSYPADSNVKLDDLATKDEIPTDYVTNETYTSGLEAKADKTVVSQISNPNLIINGDFRINQRGNTTYSSSGYTVDRWQNSNNYGTLTKSSNYITFSASGGTAYLVQPIEDSGNLVGKTVTLSVCLSDDTIYSATETLQAVANSYATIFFEWGNVRIYYYSATGYFAPTIHITDGNSVSVKWVKLELGSVATPYSIKPYAEELAMCERYFLKLDFISGQNVFVGFNGSSSSSRILIPSHLRTSPTLRYSNVSHFGVNTTGNPVTATGLSLSGYTNVGVNITVTASGLTAGQGSNLYVRQAGAYLSFDAEIY